MPNAPLVCSSWDPSNMECFVDSYYIYQFHTGEFHVSRWLHQWYFYTPLKLGEGGVINLSVERQRNQCNIFLLSNVFNANLCFEPVHTSLTFLYTPLNFKFLEISLSCIPACTRSCNTNTIVYITIFNTIGNLFYF